jgi:hypothetical protein
MIKSIAGKRANDLTRSLHILGTGLYYHNLTLAGIALTALYFLNIYFYFISWQLNRTRFDSISSCCLSYEYALPPNAKRKQEVR